MQITPKQRVMQFFEVKKIRQSGVARSTNVGKQTVNNWFNKEGDIKCGYLEKIAKAYPDLNMEWVIRGTGSMVKEDPPGAAESIEAYGSSKNIDRPTKKDMLRFVKALHHQVEILSRTTQMMAGTIRQLVEENEDDGKKNTNAAG